MRADVFASVVCAILLSSVLQKAVHEDSFIEEMEDVLGNVEASPMFLGRVRARLNITA